MPLAGSRRAAGVAAAGAGAPVAGSGTAGIASRGRIRTGTGHGGDGALAVPSSPLGSPGAHGGGGGGADEWGLTGHSPTIKPRPAPVGVAGT
jgi:hypothetical protein